MKRAATIVAVLTVILSLASCGKAKTIPDDKLSDIFCDMYIANAYAGRMTGVQWDSINIYEPILKKYGYDSNDFLQTVGDFTKRKSMRLSDIVEIAIEKLDAMGASLTGQVRLLDYIDSVAYEKSKEVVYADSLIRIRSKADSSRMEVSVPAREGRYEITYYYFQDSLDTNRNLNNRHNIRDSADVSVSNSSTRIRSRERVRYNTTLEAPSTAKERVLTFGNYPADSKPPIRLDIDSLVVVYYPPREAALEALLRSYIDYTLMINGRPYDEYYNLPADSGALHILPPLAPSEPDTVAGE